MMMRPKTPRTKRRMRSKWNRPYRPIRGCSSPRRGRPTRPPRTRWSGARWATRTRPFRGRSSDEEETDDDARSRSSSYRSRPPFDVVVAEDGDVDDDGVFASSKPPKAVGQQLLRPCVWAKNSPNTSPRPASRPNWGWSWSSLRLWCCCCPFEADFAMTIWRLLIGSKDRSCPSRPRWPRTRLSSPSSRSYWQSPCNYLARGYIN